MIVPGYGLAVAQAQHALKEVANELEKRGVTVNYAIHPVAGRMPGHMNVLLAEADVPYEKLKEMEEINPEMPRHRRRGRRRRQRRHQPGGEKRSRQPDRRDADHRSRRGPAGDRDQALPRPGFAGIDNDLFYEPNTSMLFADAKQAASDIAAEIQKL